MAKDSEDSYTIRAQYGLLRWQENLDAQNLQEIVMSEHVSNLRSTRADMLGTDDEAHYWECHKAADEIERLEAARKNWYCENCGCADCIAAENERLEDNAVVDEANYMAALDRIAELEDAAMDDFNRIADMEEALAAAGQEVFDDV